MRPVRAAARALLSGIFVVSGARSIADPESFVTRAKLVTDRVTPLLERTHPRIPTDPRALVRLNGAVQLAGGLLLASGRLTRPAAAALAGTLVPTTVAGHPFWTMDDSAERAGHRIHFMKNLGLFGGLLLAAVDTEGRPGLRYRTSHAIGRTGRVTRSGVPVGWSTGAGDRYGGRSAPPGATRGSRYGRRRRHAGSRADSDGRLSESPAGMGLHMLLFPSWAALIRPNRMHRVNVVEMSRTSVGSDTVA